MGRLGAHVSIAGGISNSVVRAGQILCDSFQIFTRNQRQWTPPPLDEEEARMFREGLGSTTMGPVLVHGSYLLNPASDREEIRRKTFSALVDELERCNRLGLERLVIHPGSHLGNGIETGISLVSEMLDRVFEVTTSVKVLLETTAGQGNGIGSKIEELAEIIRSTEDGSRLGICLDTCHMFSAGFDLTTEEGYGKTMDRIESIIGIERILGIHLNDSNNALGSRKDRHANIGEGEMGLDPFRFLVNDHRLENIPMILETPGDLDSYRSEIQLLRSLKAD